MLDGMVGVAGALVNHLVIEPGAERAVAAALGDAMGSVIVSGRDEARGAIERLAAGDAAAWLLVLDAADTAVTTGATLAPAGARPLAGFVRASLPGLQATLARTLAGVVLADGDWRAAMDLAGANPDLTVMTRAGDRFGGGRPWRFGAEQSAGVTRAALDEAITAAERAVETRDVAHGAVDRARAAVHERRDVERRAEEAARHARSAHDRAQAASERLAQRAGRPRAGARGHRRFAGGAGRGARRRAGPHRRARSAGAGARRRRGRGRAPDRGPRGRASPTSTRVRWRCAGSGASTRSGSRPSTSAARCSPAGSPRWRPASPVIRRRRRRPSATGRRCWPRAGPTSPSARRLDELTGRIDVVLGRLREERRIQAERASEAGGRLETLRSQRHEQEQLLAGVRERQQRREVEEAENRMRLEAAVERIRTDFDCEPGVALDAPAPEVPDGTTLAGRARDLDRDLRLMGPINPLALEEYEALQERHDFLVQQLDDVKNSRRELHRVIKAVDQEIVTVFDAAFADVQENFTQLFSTLFPGGSGRVFLTDPDDLLNTGIEMEARPSGKNTKRLSLLSGGERSLTAMAFLFSVFRSRPSPFYLLDEVEAALDDVNLHRFLDLVHEFRNDAQLVIVSHQKRTMEAGDCLYGVSMAPGGSTKVVSQRMRGEIVLT